MNFLVGFYPGDDTVRLAVSVALQIAGIVVLAMVASHSVARRNAVLRDGIWRAALALVCVTPLLNWGFNRAGINIWQTSAHDPERRRPNPENQAVPARIALPLVDRDDGLPKVKSRPIAKAASAVSAREAIPATPRWSDGEKVGNLYEAKAIIGTLTAIWAIGVAALLVRLVTGIWLVARLRREMKPFDLLPAVTERLLKTLGARRLPPIMVCQRIGGPASVGIWRPVAVLPASLAVRANDDMLHDTLAHECAHALRGDALIAVVQQVVAAVFWVHPLVYVLNRHLARAREEICDNVVLTGTSPTSYARTLLALSEALRSTSGRLAVIPMFDRRWRLARRVAGILDSRRIVMSRLNRPAAATIGIMAITSGFALAAICSAADPPKESSAKAAASASDPDSSAATASNDGAGKTSTTTEPKTASAPGAPRGQPAGAGELPEVPVSRVVEREVSDFEDFTGNIVAPESVKIIPRVTGYLTSTSFKEGADVNKGDKLFEIDSRPFQAEVDQAEAEMRVAETRLKLAEAEFARFKELLKSSAISQEDYNKAQEIVQEAQAALAASRANLESRKLTLSFCSITSPIDGQAGGYNMTPGNLVKQDETVLTTVVSHNSIGVSFNIDERTWLRLAKTPRDAGTKPLSVGGELRVLVRADDETSFDQEGVLTSIGNEFDRTTGTIVARGTIANPPLKSGARLFVPGMHVIVRLIVGRPHKALLVTNEAIFATAVGPMVWVVNNDDRAEERAIKQGQLQDDGLRAVVSGLAADERVVVKPQGVSAGKIRPKLVPMVPPNRERSKRQN